MSRETVCILYRHCYCVLTPVLRHSPVNFPPDREKQKNSLILRDLNRGPRDQQSQWNQKKLIHMNDYEYEMFTYIFNMEPLWFGAPTRKCSSIINEVILWFTKIFEIIVLSLMMWLFIHWIFDYYVQEKEKQLNLF